MQELCFPHLSSQQDYHGELQASIFGVAQKMFLMGCTKKGFSTNEIQKKLGLKCYKPIWSMVHKLRKTMVNRNVRCTLEDMIELEEGYFSVCSMEIECGKARLSVFFLLFKG